MATFSSGQTRTVCSEQGLSSEEGGLQHVCCLYDQHVLQPAQVLKLQSFIGLKGMSGREVKEREEGNLEQERKCETKQQNVRANVLRQAKREEKVI